MGGKRQQQQQQQEEDDNSVSCWDVSSVLADEMHISPGVAGNIVHLLEDGCTIPFIARYRKENTANMDAGKLREASDVYQELVAVQTKAEVVCKQISKQGKLTAPVKAALAHSHSMVEIEHIYAPFKTGSKRTLAERARTLGLEPIATEILQGRNVNPCRFLQPNKKGLQTMEEVETGIQHIIADIISKDKNVLDRVRELSHDAAILLKVTKAKTVKKKVGNDVKNKENEHKFEIYYNYSSQIRTIRPHQTLAINRGESLGVLSVKVDVPQRVADEITRFCTRKYMAHPASARLVCSAVADAYKRLLNPLMCRKIRSELTKAAENTSLEVFGGNLKRLLLTPPVRGKAVLGIDPGFKHGCKMAVCSSTGDILRTAVIYPFCNPSLMAQARDKKELVNIVKNYNVDVVAVGNGTACRETEEHLSRLIQAGAFRPLDIVYCIVDESGASIYSVSEEAAKEMPDLDTNFRSVFRRWSEYCAFFHRRVSGLNAKQAQNIIEWRRQHGRFTNRRQLLAIKGIGPKTFEQCAGFVRITSDNACPLTCKTETMPYDAKPSSSGAVKRKAASAGGGKLKKAKTTEVEELQLDPLDRTCIHPESYPVASKLLKLLGVRVEDIGKPMVVTSMKRLISTTSVSKLANDMSVGEPTMQLIVEGLQQPMGYDIRAECQTPLFRKGVCSLASLAPHARLTGQVRNVTSFGAFVDAGVGCDGLVHVSRMSRAALRGKPTLELGDRVEVAVLNVDVARKRLGLELVALL
ncbi:PREDICTED: S1 RNA-binding domain-containing protein 1-like [Priapulus caudatus]|uniref:S1 RNA-binding domain-containing protein 1-like n=1 Tax=Priapulus caudatus TaxID=37621 RepID=A0ABM1EE45_PRICU|nr:PREDICTED: S1 RNA-binding domain-containing protein 1-like [Priapulus caudatus]